MFSSVGRTVGNDQAAGREDTVDDGLGEVGAVQDIAPLGDGQLIGGKDHRPFALVAFVDDVEEDVGGVGAVGKVSDLTDDEDVGLEVLPVSQRGSLPSTMAPEVPTRTGKRRHVQTVSGIPRRTR